MAVTTALVAGSVVAAGSSYMGSRAASNAAQEGAAGAVGEQRRQYDLTRSDLAPYMGVGKGALGQLARLYGMSPGGKALPGGADMSGFTESPDYQFNLEQGQKAIDRSLASRGRALSGAGVKEGQRYASGMASQQYGDYFNRLASLAGIGQSATTSAGAFGTQTAGNIGNAMMAGGNARASGYMGAAQGVNNAVQGGISNYLLYQYMRPQG